MTTSSICPGDTLVNPVTGETITFRRTSAQTDGELVEVEVTVEAGGGVAAAHVHPFQSERFEILEGTFELRRGRRKVTATAGDVVTVEPGTVHSFRNVGDTPATFL
ncbi:MAG: cupin domain-containing protein [Gaiellaceae bacterium]